ncbi:MAG: hypothetical protein IJO88_05980 [Oscillospiraceae bacterium]|nr:hypothetical protein [Oscillospiraceae bacterium]
MKGTLFYSDKGLASNDRPQEGSFFIRENLNDEFRSARYSYQGDEIIRSIENQCANLYDLFQHKIFLDREEEYEAITYMLPIGITEAGLNSDCPLPKEYFKHYFEDVPTEENFLNFLSPRLNRVKYHCAYLADCQSLISTLQELILSANDSFIGFYKLLATLPEKVEFYETHYEISSEGRLVFNMLHSLIIQLYSAFDITTKIAYELENIRLCEGEYVKLASKGLLYGDRKKLKMDKTGTIFESNRQLSIIENLRNELIHNAIWEMHPKVFFIKENGRLTERAIYMPDFNEEGHLVTFKNRKRFFADEKKVNEELPAIYLEVMRRIYKTLENFS